MKTMATIFLAVLLTGCESASSHIRYSGGDGSTIAAAVFIKGANGRQAVTGAEKAWLLKRYPSHDGKLLSTFSYGDRFYDMWDGSPVVIFDVTNLHVDRD